METKEYLFEPMLSDVYQWAVIGSILIVLTVLGMIPLGKKQKAGSVNKFKPLGFLLLGFLFLVALTITVFNVFNIVQTKELVLSQKELRYGEDIVPLSRIRESSIHREGSGVPFKGMGVKRTPDKSLIIVLDDGKSFIFSEDLYPIRDIMAKLDELKSKGG